MNILIIGEFSAFAKHLKNGFELLGNKVIIVQDGDGFKKIPASSNDIIYDGSRDLKVFGRHVPMSNILFFKQTNKYICDKLIELNIKFDLLVIICDSFISLNNYQLGVSYEYIKDQVSNGAKIILTSCGGDSAYQLFRKEHWYYKIAFSKSLKNLKNERPTRKKVDKLKRILDMCNCIVATAYDYYYTMNRFKDVYYRNDINLKYIPLPISENEAIFSSCKNRKIVIFHGVIRSRHKGTPYIIEALTRLKNEYPDKVDVVIKGGMSYTEYCKLFERIDILVDQTNGFGTGINANIGLMSGKVVLSNNEPEEEQLRGYKSPVINICPKASQIYNELVNLISDPQKIDRLKTESRIYAKKYLNSAIIAKSYLDSVDLNNYQSKL